MICLEYAKEEQMQFVRGLLLQYWACFLVMMKHVGMYEYINC